MVEIDARRVGQEIRTTHHYGFRSGDWARVVGWLWDTDAQRYVWLVRFPDGKEDRWVCSDILGGYEFRPAHRAGLAILELSLDRAEEILRDPSD